MDAPARIGAARGEIDRARELLAAGDALRDRLAHVVDDGDRVDAVEARKLIGPGGPPVRQGVEEKGWS